MKRILMVGTIVVISAMVGAVAAINIVFELMDKEDRREL